MPDAITKFTGEFAFLSNFAQGSGDPRCPTVEHQFQAAKTTDPDEQAWVREAPTPAQAKRRGRKVTLRQDWEETKIQVMREAVRGKFQDPELRQKLLSTGTAHLEEGNSWGDRFWGTVKGKGKNHLGRILTEVREELRKEV